MKRFLLLLTIVSSFLVSTHVDAQIDKKKIFYQLTAVSAETVDSDYQAVLDRATALGYTLPSSGQQVKQNQLVVDLKAAGVWSLLDVLYVFATDGNNDFATLNWKAPLSYKITRVGTTTFTANQGYVSNGTTGYLNTGWIPSTNGVNYTLNSASLITYMQSHVTLSASDLGSAQNFLGGANRISFNADDGFGSALGAVNQTGSATVANGGNCVGLWHVQRKDASNNYIFKNGSQVDTEADASNGVSNINMYLLCLNNGGTAQFFSTRRMGMFAAGASLNGLESALYTAWNTYFTGL